MLKYSTRGPYSDGASVFVVYPISGTLTNAIVCECSTLQLAQEEVARLNAAQIDRETAIKRDRELRGMDGVYPELDGA